MSAEIIPFPRASKTPQADTAPQPKAADADRPHETALKTLREALKALTRAEIDAMGPRSRKAASAEQRAYRMSTGRRGGNYHYLEDASYADDLDAKTHAFIDGETVKITLNNGKAELSLEYAFHGDYFGDFHAIGGNNEEIFSKIKSLSEYTDISPATAMKIVGWFNAARQPGYEPKRQADPNELTRIEQLIEAVKTVRKRTGRTQ